MLTKTQNNVISYCGAAAVPLLVLACLGRPPTSVFPGINPSQHAHAARSDLASALWFVHFARRTIESAFLERHGSQKIAMADSLGEFAYYWIFAAWISYSLAAPWQLLQSPVASSFAVCGWVVAELANFYAHLILSRTTAKDGKRVLPRSLLFSLVCCPHYLAEVLSWVCFVLVCPSLASILFTLTGAAIMTGYALERHRKYAASTLPSVIFCNIWSGTLPATRSTRAGAEKPSYHSCCEPFAGVTWCKCRGAAACRWRSGIVGGTDEQPGDVAISERSTCSRRGCRSVHARAEACRSNCIVQLQQPAHVPEAVE